MLTTNHNNGNSTQTLTEGSTISVQVSAWRMGAKNENHSIPSILKSQGFSNKEIYKAKPDGTSLLAEVAKLNNLKYPNLVKAGETLLVPVKVA